MSDICYLVENISDEEAKEIVSNIMNAKLASLDEMSSVLDEDVCPLLRACKDPEVELSAVSKDRAFIYTNIPALRCACEKIEEYGRAKIWRQTSEGREVQEVDICPECKGVVLEEEGEWMKVHRFDYVLRTRMNEPEDWDKIIRQNEFTTPLLERLFGWYAGAGAGVGSRLHIEPLQEEGLSLPSVLQREEDSVSFPPKKAETYNEIFDSVEEGWAFLDTERGQRWLESKEGVTWLDTDEGKKWLESEAGWEWSEQEEARN